MRSELLSRWLSGCRDDIAYKTNIHPFLLLLLLLILLIVLRLLADDPSESRGEVESMKKSMKKRKRIAE